MNMMSNFRVLWNCFRIGIGLLIAVGIKLLFFLLYDSGTFGGFIAMGICSN